MKRRLEFQIRGDYAGRSIVDFLAHRFSYHTPELWRQKAIEGRILVNGRPAAPDHVLVAGELVAYEAHDIPEPPIDDRVAVVFEDPDLLIINKSANLPCHPGGRYFNHTLWAILKKQFQLQDPIFVNRIDRETSGLVVVAKTPESGRGCRAQFAGRTVDKRYFAVVEGRFPETLDARGYLTDDPAAGVRKMRRFVPVADEAVPPDGERATTRFLRLKTAGDLSLIDVRPETGRLHQIRATLYAYGFPIVGDKLYGRDPNLFLRFCKGAITDEDRKILRLDRQALHAASLRFRHPRNQRELFIEAPLPDDMAALFPDTTGNAADSTMERRI